MCSFIGFTFTFEIDHVQQGGERMEKGGGTVIRPANEFCLFICLFIIFIFSILFI